MRELAFIESFLRENMGYAREKFDTRAQITVTSKRDATDLLTEVDLTVQKRAETAIKKLYPDDQFVAEEGEAAKLPAEPSGRCWVMDPIDGTNNFVRGLFPIFGIALGFAVDGVPVAGGVALPGLGDVFLAEQGHGATCNGKPLRVSQVQRLEEARVDIDFSTIADRRRLLEVGAELIATTGQLRCHGSAVASLVQVASGDADAYVHMSLSPWDYAAAQIIIEEAGGMATRHDGSPLRLFDGRSGVIFSNGALHEQLIGHLHRG